MSEGPATPETTAPKSRERVWLALAPAFIYAFAFTFEAGYADSFGIPYDLIRLDIERILTVGGVVLGAVWSAVQLLQWLPIPVRIMRIVLERLIFPAYVGLMLWAILFVTHAGWIWKALAGVLLALVAYAELIQPISKYRDKGGLLARWEAAAAEYWGSRAKQMQGSLFHVGVEKLTAAVGRDLLMRVFWFLWIGIIVSRSAGVFTADWQRTFLVDPDMPRVLLLRRWGDQFVGVTVDSATGALTHDFRLVPVNDLKSRRLTLVRMHVHAAAPVDTIPPWNRAKPAPPVPKPATVSHKRAR
jgi:hypothetical protein